MSARRLATPGHCASCAADDPAWSRAPAGVFLPKVDLIYDCQGCGQTTLQGRITMPRL